MTIRLFLTLLLATSAFFTIGCEETETPPDREVAQTKPEPQLPPEEPLMDRTEVRPADRAAGDGTDRPHPSDAAADDGETEEAAEGGGPPPTDHRTAEFLNFRAPKPATWIWQPPQSTMRVANYSVPGQEGSDQAEVAIFQGIGGTRDENVTRWVNQFRPPDGGIVEPEISMHEADGMAVTLVELSGAYNPGMGQQWYTENQMMLAAILQAPEGDIHIKLVGPTETVEANREAFMEFITGIEQAD